MWRHVWLLSPLAALAAGQRPTATGSTHTVTSTPATTASPVTASVTAVVSTQTCENLSINYLTHRLPQQCLGRTSSPYTRPAGSDTTSNTSTPASSADSGSNASINITTNNDPNASTTSVAASLGEQPTKVQATPLSVPTVDAQPADAEEESLLDNAKFLSFEDWKKQNIAQKGIPDGKKASTASSRERRRPGINNALEGLGEDAEIEIDFGFASHEPLSHTSLAEKAEASEDAASAKSQTVQKRSKDAGKTCKERFNYASFDCAANVLKTNPKCKSASSVLVENKDSYMLNECSQDNKFVIVELCESVLIDTLVLANFEFFSSMFRNFRVSVSDRYPVKADKWINLGTFEARNSRDIQAFLIETSPDVFARYLRIEFLSHYGSEYYCPLSLVRVHGITMFEQYRMSISTDNDDPEEEEVAVAEASHDLAVPGSITVTEVQGTTEKIVIPDSESAKPLPDSSSPVVAEVPPADPVSKETPTENVISDTGNADAAVTKSVCPTDASVEEAIIATSNETCLNAPVTSGPKSVNETVSAITTSSGPSVAPKVEQPVTAADSSSPPRPANATSIATSPGSSQSSEKQTGSASPQSVGVTSITTTTAAVVVPTESLVRSPPSSSPPVVTPANPSVPATQESFFKSVHNRLSLLEANSTLSLQYIESQSQLLREAFSKVEKRNAATTSKFLDMLNSTVLAELARYTGEYEQIWQSTVLELASQRDEGRRERELLGERVRLLAEEMVAQKRLMAAQATLLLLCLSIVVFAKFGTAGVDSGLVAGVQELVSMRRGRRRGASQSNGGGGKHQHRRQVASMSLGRRWPWESPWTSPPRSRDITRPQTATGLDNDKDLSDSVGETASIDQKLPAAHGSFGSDTDEGHYRPSALGRDVELLDEHDNNHHSGLNGTLIDATPESSRRAGAGDSGVKPDAIHNKPLGLGLEGLDGLDTLESKLSRNNSRGGKKKRKQHRRHLSSPLSKSAPTTPRLGVDSNSGEHKASRDDHIAART